MGTETIKLDDSSYDLIWEKATAGLAARAAWWSHRAASDPGITLMEMWAVLCDMQSFYLDQMQESHYRSYLKLLGMEPDEGSCARAWVLFGKAGTDCVLPAGYRLLADTMVFETGEETELTANRICGFYRGADGYQAPGMLLSRKHRFALKKAKVLFSLLLENPLQAGHRFSFYVLLDEQQRNPPDSEFTLVRLAWEYRTEDGWQEAQVLRDDTRGLLCSGCICLGLGSFGTAEGGREIRCRVVEGEYDRMPVLYKISLNAAEVIQRDTRCCQEYGEFSEACPRIELRCYLAKTGNVRVFAEQEKGHWREITRECVIGPPVSSHRLRRYVYFKGSARCRFVCSARGFEEEYGPCAVTGVTGQRISLPWDNILRDSVELMLAQGEGIYRDYRRTDPEEVRWENAWHWGETGSEIVLGDGRHGEIPLPSGNGLVLTSLALFEGEKGNVSIGRITKPETQELFCGITCRNPMTGRGGRNRKRPSEQFREAGDGLLRQERIVTGKDAEMLAGRTPGLLIREARAEWKERTLVVTVVPGVSLESEFCRQAYREQVEKYLEQYRPAGMGLRVETAGGESHAGTMSFREISG